MSSYGGSRALPHPWLVNVRMPFLVDKVPALRHRIVADAIKHGVSPEAVGVLALIVGELMSNAVRHAKPLPDGRIAVSWGGTHAVVRFEVTDGGGGSQPMVVLCDPTDTTGRGLALVSDVAADWGTVIDPDFTTVWATVEDRWS